MKQDAFRSQIFRVKYQLCNKLGNIVLPVFWFSSYSTIKIIKETSDKTRKSPCKPALQGTEEIAGDVDKEIPSHDSMPGTESLHGTDSLFERNSTEEGCGDSRSSTPVMIQPLQMEFSEDPTNTVSHISLARRVLILFFSLLNGYLNSAKICNPVIVVKIVPLYFAYISDLDQ